MDGTSFPQAGLLLVEQPGAWGRQGLAESDFDRDVALALEHRADAADLRLLAVRRPDRPDRTDETSGRRAWAVRPAGSATTWWGRYDDDTDLLDLPLDANVGQVGVAWTDPTYLVCTHAKRDACCAIYARPIAAVLEALRPGQVWGCSHTGGHRFAPVVLAVPTSGPGAAMYGHVTPGGVVEIVAATEDGRVVPELLRGLTGHPAYVQAALAHVLRDHPVPGDWWVLGALASAADRWEVDLGGPVPQTVTVVAETTPEPMVSCGKPDPSDQTHYRVSTAPR